VSVSNLIQSLTTDAALRDRFRQAPDQVVEEHGIELNDEQRQRLTSEDWASHDDATLIDKVTSNPGLGTML
jgi:hypothetical protein